MTEDHYQRYFERFDPDLYDARDWARRAKAAGMVNAVLRNALRSKDQLQQPQSGLQGQPALLTLV